MKGIFVKTSNKQTLSANVNKGIPDIFFYKNTDYHHYLLLGQPEKRQKEINYFYQRTISVGGEKTRDLFLSRSCIISKYLW